MSENKTNNIEIKTNNELSNNISSKNTDNSFLKNFDMYKVGHIAIEVLVIGGIYWNLNKKIIELQNSNIKLKEEIDTLKTKNSNDISEDTINKVNYVSENLDNILNMNSNNSKHFQNLYNLIKNLDMQQKVILKNINTKPLDILTGSPIKSTFNELSSSEHLLKKTKLNAIEIVEEEPTPVDVLDAELQEDDEPEPEITTTQPPKKK